MIATRDSVTVGVPAMSAYEHLVRFDDVAHYLSGVLSLAPLTDTTAHLVLDVGGRRVEFDAVIVVREPGRYVRWQATDSPLMAESFWLESLPGERVQVRGEMEVDDGQMPFFDAAPQVMLHNRLHMDLKGLKRYCEEHHTH
jgi:uncharacterized membrane protein